MYQEVEQYYLQYKSLAEKTTGRVLSLRLNRLEVANVVVIKMRRIEKFNWAPRWPTAQIKYV